MTTTSAGPAPTIASPAPPRRRRSGGGAPYLVFLVPGALLLLVVILLPLVMNVGISFTTWTGVGTPEWTGFDNYERLFSDGAFWASFRHNVGLIVAMAILPTLAGLVVAAALFDVVGTRFGPRAAAVLRACVYLPQIVPVAVAGIIWSWMLAPRDGALNRLLEATGLASLAQDWLGDPDLALYSVMGVLVWFQLGYPVVIFVAGLQRVDPALYEAAELDGASWWRRFWHITVPQIRPEIFVVVLTCTIAALKVFGPIYVLTRGGPGGATSVPSYLSYQSFFEKTQVGYGAAIATVLTVLILLLTAGFLRLQNRAEGGERS
ncbi:carbohydrate ABC transporter permease [Umezawaea beigongshangensis]|uniref:carbohydrate ABC transporter permease n=1 Tax=Umezawaea beigongshangensis TaxID=2780383 RepID=UPI0027DB2D5A|nr:sugar ABC transporter permease [Umezawaea beigongshangensis]